MSALSIKTAAAELEVSEDFVRGAVNRLDLPAYRVGRLIRIDREDLMDWFRNLPRVGAAS